MKVCGNTHAMAVQQEHTVWLCACVCVLWTARSQFTQLMLSVSFTQYSRGLELLLSLLPLPQ